MGVVGGDDGIDPAERYVEAPPATQTGEPPNAPESHALDELTKTARYWSAGASVPLAVVESKVTEPATVVPELVRTSSGA